LLFDGPCRFALVLPKILWPVWFAGPVKAVSGLLGLNAALGSFGIFSRAD
jgi:hypothetical protein